MGTAQGAPARKRALKLQPRQAASKVSDAPGKALTPVALNTQARAGPRIEARAAQQDSASVRIRKRSPSPAIGSGVERFGEKTARRRPVTQIHKRCATISLANNGSHDCGPAARCVASLRAALTPTGPSAGRGRRISERWPAMSIVHVQGGCHGEGSSLDPPT